jgi:hypothetical protein
MIVPSEIMTTVCDKVIWEIDFLPAILNNSIPEIINRAVCHIKVKSISAS